jgi:hypothetical protein
MESGYNTHASVKSVKICIGSFSDGGKLVIILVIILIIILIFCCEKFAILLLKKALKQHGQQNILWEISKSIATFGERKL